MKSAIIYLAILAFIIFSASFASRSEQLKRAAVLENLKKVEVVHAEEKLLRAEVLGANYQKTSVASISAVGKVGETVLKRLQDSHVVIVEYTDEGALVKGIDGTGNTENDRLSGKSWKFTVNDKSSTLPPDRYSTRDGDIIVWEYK